MNNCTTTRGPDLPADPSVMRRRTRPGAAKGQPLGDETGPREFQEVRDLHVLLTEQRREVGDDQCPTCIRRSCDDRLLGPSGYGMVSAAPYGAVRAPPHTADGHMQADRG